MEAVMKLQEERWKFKISLSQIVEGILLAAFVMVLYLGGLSWENSEDTSMGKNYLVKTNLQMMETYPDLADQKLLHSLYAHPEAMELVNVMKELPEKEVLLADRSVLSVRETSVEEVADAQVSEEENPSVSPEAAVPVSIQVKAYGNGGHPQLSELTLEDYNLDVTKMNNPRRLGKVFDGWYTDASCTTPFTSVSEGEELVELYAGWKEFSGFICDDRGYITGYSAGDVVAFDDLVVLPTSEDCLGVEAGAFSGLEDRICEIYLPANITYIAPGALDGLYNLFYIKVAEGNLSYYDEAGILYNRDGTLAVWPAGRRAEE